MSNTASRPSPAMVNSREYVCAGVTPGTDVVGSMDGPPTVSFAENEPESLADVTGNIGSRSAGTCNIQYTQCHALPENTSNEESNSIN